LLKHKPAGILFPYEANQSLMKSPDDYIIVNPSLATILHRGFLKNPCFWTVLAFMTAMMAIAAYCATEFPDLAEQLKASASNSSSLLYIPIVTSLVGLAGIVAAALSRPLAENQKAKKVIEPLLADTTKERNVAALLDHAVQSKKISPRCALLTLRSFRHNPLFIWTEPVFDINNPIGHLFAQQKAKAKRRLKEKWRKTVS
jgi:hypothetical protein